MARHNPIIDTTIAGIPCKVEVTHYFVQKPLGPRADSDLDCYGYTDIEYLVLDRRGYPAAWLAEKMDDRDVEQLENEIKETME